MLLAYSYLLAKRNGVIFDASPSASNNATATSTAAPASSTTTTTTTGTTAANPRGLLLGTVPSLVIGGVLGVISLWYLMFAVSCSDKAYCNHVHTFVSPFIVIAFVFVRNLTVRLRKYHSRFFAYIGRLSLELFLLQFHIWLAADTKGILLLIPGSGQLARVLNAVVTTSLFVTLSDYASELSSPVVAAIAPGDNWVSLRRFSMLLVFCGLLWFHRQIEVTGY